MPLTPLERTDVRTALADFLAAHVAAPFHILRERGAVAQLRQVLLLAESLNAPAPATVTRHRPWPVHETLSSCFPVDVLRVQLELSLGRAKPGPGEPDLLRKDVDIGILSRSPELLIAPHGPGDVLQQVDPASLSAAIEVKACPTVDYVQRGHCVADLSALLHLKREFDVDGFFVLLDKSHAHYGTWVPKPSPDSGAMMWETDLEQQIHRKRKGKVEKRHSSLRDAGLEIFARRPQDHRPCVELWALFEGDGEWRADCRYVREATEP